MDSCVIPSPTPALFSSLSFKVGLVEFQAPSSKLRVTEWKENCVLKAERSVCVSHQLSRVQTCRKDKKIQESLIGRGCSMRGWMGEEVIPEWVLPRTSHGNSFEDPQAYTVIIRVTSQSNQCNKSNRKDKMSRYEIVDFITAFLYACFVCFPHIYPTHTHTLWHFYACVACICIVHVNHIFFNMCLFLGLQLLPQNLGCCK